MKFSATAWQHALPIYQAIVQHPFNQELMHGTLSHQRLSYYVEQDELYLKDYARVLTLTGARSPNSQHAKVWIDFAMSALAAEQTCVHSFFQDKGNYQPLNKQSLACLAYTSYLLQTAALAPLEVAVAATLPCPWVYHELAKQMLPYLTDNHPFTAWISFYAGEMFEAEVKKAITIFDELAAQASQELKNQMLDAFYQSCVLEWHFWQDAYQLSHTIHY